MKQRLDRESRLHAATEAVTEEGRRHGRGGWVTQSIVAHAMGLRPGGYVLGLLNELTKEGTLFRVYQERPRAKILFRIEVVDDSGPSQEIPF